MEIDLDKIITDLVKDLATTVVDKTVGIGAKHYKQALVDFERCFTKYIKRSYERYSKIKTLLYRDRPVDLKTHYVATDFTLGEDEHISGAEIIQRLIKNKRNVILGTAGSGKSVLLRRAFIDLVEQSRGMTPILIELRLLITPNSIQSIFDFIHKILSESDENITNEQIHYAFKEGKIILFLDGFDEIDFEEKEIYEREILELSNKYPKSVIIVSSRPDDCFSSWDEYFVYHALPLNQEQSVDLIQRIEYDKTVKNKFIKELEDGLYEKHTDFLSNPLLLTMMLLTYEQLAEIPEKIHIFYEQAFDTLYHKHDALKSLYKRKSYSALPADDFKRIFSAFCMITYSERKMSFSYQDIIDHITQSIEIEGSSVNPAAFFNDLVKSVCIIQKDGNIYTFSHRSFQEYFAAYFISKSQSIDVAAVLDKIAMSHFRDNVISMLFELNREQIEALWIIPRLDQILSQTKRPESLSDVMKFLSLFHSKFSFHPEGVGFSLSEKKILGFSSNWLHRLYKEESDLFFPLHVDEEESERIASGKRELSLFKEHLDIDVDHNEIAYSEMPNNIDWLRETDIPLYCQKRFDFMTHLHNILTKKYLERKNNLASILFAESITNT